MAALETATPSAPKARALAKSGAVRKPPVIIKVTSSGPTPFSSRYFRALARAGIVGIEI